MRTTLLIAGLAALAAMAGCRGTDEEPEGPRWITLPPGATVATEAAAEGGTRLVVTVPEERPGAGTWTSSSPHLVATAGRLMESLGRPGSRLEIEVSPAGEILRIRESATRP